ncbi:MAG: hypothetical protein P8Z37_11105 [Acidobacteriota bacterium]
MKRMFYLQMLVVFLMILLISLSYAFAGKPDKPGKPGDSEPPPTPQESEGGVLDLSGINIVTVQPDGDGSLHVWSNNGADSAWDAIESESSWTILDVHHSSVAIGDLDGDTKNEIIVPAACSFPEGYPYPYGIFINAYEEGDNFYDDLIKEGVMDVWGTTWYSPYDWIEEDMHWRNEIRVADLDGDEMGDEIVLITNEHIAIFDYVLCDPDQETPWLGEGTIIKVADISLAELIDGFTSGGTASVEIGNVAGGDDPDIIVTINSVEDGIFGGYLVIFKDPFAVINPDDENPQLNLLSNSVGLFSELPSWGYNQDGIQLSDFNGTKFNKIWTGYSTRYEVTEPYLRGKKLIGRTVIRYGAYLSYWDTNSLSESTTPVELQKDTSFPYWFKMATGDIITECENGMVCGGDEIVIGMGSSISVFNASDLMNQFPAGPLKTYSPTVEPGIGLNKLAIYDGKIIFGGASGSDLSLYLGVIDPSEFVNPIWELVSGSGREAWDFAVIKK